MYEYEITGLFSNDYDICIRLVLDLIGIDISAAITI